jgi:hypothetical protein
LLLGYAPVLPAQYPILLAHALHLLRQGSCLGPGVEEGPVVLPWLFTFRESLWSGRDPEESDRSARNSPPALSNAFIWRKSSQQRLLPADRTQPNFLLFVRSKLLDSYTTRSPKVCQRESSLFLLFISLLSYFLCSDVSCRALSVFPARSSCGLPSGAVPPRATLPAGSFEKNAFTPRTMSRALSNRKTGKRGSFLTT